MLKVILGIMAMDMALAMHIHIMDMPLLAHVKTTLEFQFHVPLAARSVKLRLSHGGDMATDMD